MSAQAQPDYGTDAAHGHYVQTADARLYYERYGAGGTPLVLLHGGEYGYIDEFADLIRAVSARRAVIAVATRGYGRSERGTAPLSYRRFADDAFAVIGAAVPAGQQVDVLGFSDGAVTAYLLAAAHPERVRRLVAIGGPLGPSGMTVEAREAFEGDPVTPARLQREVPALVAKRKAAMAHPEGWEPLIRELEQMYRAPVYVRQDEVRRIAAPTLVMAGDRDPYNALGSLVEVFRLLPRGQLAVVPGCDHVVLDCKPQLVVSTVTAFLDQP